MEIDDVLNQFAHFIYDEQDGGGLKLLEKVKAGMEFYLPGLIGKLPKTELSLQGWKKVYTSRPHFVCPKEVAYIIAQELFESGEPHCAHAVLLSFDTYMRVGDVIGLLSDHVFVLPPSDAPRGHEAVLSIVKGKKDNFATAYVRPRFLAEILDRWRQERMRTLGGDGKMLGGSAQRFTTRVKSVCETLGIAAFQFTPHTF